MSAVTGITIYKYFRRYFSDLLPAEFMEMWYAMEQDERLEWMENFETLSSK